MGIEPGEAARPDVDLRQEVRLLREEVTALRVQVVRPPESPLVAAAAAVELQGEVARLRDVVEAMADAVEAQSLLLEQVAGDLAGLRAALLGA